jgi:hypothetical protein
MAPFNNSTDISALLNLIETIVVDDSFMHEIAHDFGVDQHLENFLAYIAICGTFMLQILNEAKYKVITTTNSQETIPEDENGRNKEKKTTAEALVQYQEARAREILQSMGAQDNLPITYGIQIIAAATDFCERFIEQVHTRSGLYCHPHEA